MDLSSMPKNRVILIGVGVLFVLILGVVFIFFSRTPATSGPAVLLKIWGTDSKEAFAGVFAAYNTGRPNVTLEYTQVPEDKYADELVNAFATGKGPDVFMIGNNDVRKYSRLMAPATSTQLRASQLGSVFPQAVSENLIYRGLVYALPLYIDTLALVYNRDKLDQAGIAVPPPTWEEFVAAVPRLRSENAQGQLLAAAAGIGGTEKTVMHAADIVSLLMLQNGAILSDPNGEARFADAVNGKGIEAFQFYLDFANAGSNAYTWNESRPNSLESLLAGNTAMAFAYRDDIAGFAKKSPFLKWSIAPMPQIQGNSAVNYPRYDALAVWVGSRNQTWAWDFVIGVTTNETAMAAYSAAANRPAALRTLLAKQVNSAELGIFAKQALTARSWAVPDYDKMRSIMSDAITKVLRGETAPETALKEAETAINQNR